MKRFIGILLAAFLLLTVLSVTVLAAENSVVYIEFNSGRGNDANSGLTDAVPKSTLGNMNGNGAVGVVKNGGTVVISQKMYLANSYKWETNGPVTVTAYYGGKDYKNTSPAHNPASGVMKMLPGSTLTVASDLTFDDMILFQENDQCTILVESGATFTVNENVITMSNQKHFMKVLVKEGGKAIINGGTFSSVTGDGEIVIGEKANILNDATADAPTGTPTGTSTAEGDVAYVNWNLPGTDLNDGISAATPKMTLGGAAGVIKNGGTLVFTGRGYFRFEYTWKVAGDTIFTANFGGVDHKNPTPASNPTSGMLKMMGGSTFTVASNVTMKDMILFHEGAQSTIRVSDGATLTIDESIVTMSNSALYYNIVVDEGSTAIINGGTFSDVTGDGEIVTGKKAKILSKPNDNASDVEGDVAYVNWNLPGTDLNDGISAETPKMTLGGAAGVIKNGGTLVFTGRGYFRGEYTWKVAGDTIFTANFGGVDHKNPTPASNPTSGMFKMMGGSTFTVASNVTMKDMILFHENAQSTIRVSDGATLTIDESIVTMSNSALYYNIVVDEGSTAIINGGTFSDVTGDGEIVIGEKARILSKPNDNASDVEGAFVYVNWNPPGSDANDGLSAETPKMKLGAALGLLKNGGTLVFTGRGYISGNSTWRVAGDTVFTANFGGVDYKNPEPASNPANGMFKMMGGTTFSIMSNVTMRDMILFHEWGQSTILVAGGATLTIDESIVTMTNTDLYYNIIVAEGATAIINGGTFNAVDGPGNIVIGPKATILHDDVDLMTKDYIYNVVKTVYLDYNKGDDVKKGESADSAVHSYGGGVFKHITVGGTVVVSGGSVIAGDSTGIYKFPTLAKTLTFTSVYDGVDYRDKSTFLITDGTELVISSDVVMDNLVMQGNQKEGIIRVTNNAALTMTDTVSYVAAEENGVPYTIEVEKGSYLFIAPALKDKFNIKGEGTVIDYVDGYSEIVGDRLGDKKYVELTIGSPVAYINGVANTLDAAPINRNSRTMLPVRFLANTFGIDNDGIEWNDATKTATLKNATTTIVITIGAPTMTVNGAAVALDSPAVIENSRTYLPVRVIANALGVSNDNISWNDNTKTATLIK